MARFDAAAADILRVLGGGPAGDDILMRYITRARAGEAAQAELEANAGRLKTQAWPYAAIELMLGRRTPEATLEAAVKSDDRCRASFYVAQWQILQRDAAAAARQLRSAASACRKTHVLSPLVAADLQRLSPPSPASPVKPPAARPPAPANPRP